MIDLTSANQQQLTVALVSALLTNGSHEVEAVLINRAPNGQVVLQTFSNVSGALLWLQNVNNPSEWTSQLQLKLFDSNHALQAMDSVAGPALPYSGSGYTTPSYWPAA